MKIKGLEGKKIQIKKIRKRWIALGVVVLLIAGVAVNAASKGNQVPQIPAVQVARGDVETIVSASGVVESEDCRVYYAPLNAKVAKVNVEKGDSVKKGDVLLTYDTEDLEFTQREGSLEAVASENSYLSAIAESDKQQKIYNDSTQTLAELEVLIDFQQNFIDDLKNYITDEKAKRRLDLLNEKYKLNRQQNGIAVNMEIKPDGKITDSMWSAEYEVKNKIAEIDKKIEALDLNEELTDIEQQIVKEQEKLEDMKETKADLKADQSSAENAILNDYKKKELEATAQKTKISEERAQAHLDEALDGITAEFNGVITELDVHDGFVTDQSSKLMTVESSENVRVNISLSKYDLEKVTEGQKAEVTVAGKKYDGVVSKINHVAEKNDAGTRLVTAQIHIDNPDKSIYLGIEGRVLIHAQTSKDTLVVPFAAINTDQQGDFCYVISDGVVERRSVTVGLTSEDQMEILEGLSEGDVVITDSSMGVEEGMAAEP
ncbi:MAG: efflux RND transporter periplasmic adaptor subunit, partial [Lachnospiraceae bacterium]